MAADLHRDGLRPNRIEQFGSGDEDDAGAGQRQQKAHRSGFITVRFEHGCATRAKGTVSHNLDCTYGEVMVAVVGNGPFVERLLQGGQRST